MCLTGKKGKLIHVKDVPKLGRDEPPPGVIRAWRSWKLQNDGMLRSSYKTTSWPPIVPMQTHKPIKSDLEAVGVHAVKRPNEIHLLLGSTAAKDAVVGEVLLWGDVAEHENGYRGEFGYPYRLWTNDFLATSTLRDKYGVAVEIKSVRDLMADYPRGG